MHKIAALVLTAICASAPLQARAEGASDVRVASVDHDTREHQSSYDWCKKDAFAFGAMGGYRRLYVLSCLGNDTTSAIDTKR